MILTVEFKVTTSITITIDDHVFLPPNFLPHVLAPFEDPGVGEVGVQERVRRTVPNYSLAALCNVLGALYSEQWQWSYAATCAVDGGLMVIPGRLYALRTAIVQNQAFLNAYSNEYFAWGLMGPVIADEDNCIMRWNIRHGWRLAFQYCEGACIETLRGEHGGYARLFSQFLRWQRGELRLYFTGLFDDLTAWTFPWCIYAVTVSGITSNALIFDSGLLYTFWLALQESQNSNTKLWMTLLCTWILVSKLVKKVEYFRRNPADLVYLPACILFAYYHSFIKMYAAVTWWKMGWTCWKFSDSVHTAKNTKKERKDWMGKPKQCHTHGKAEEGACVGEATSKSYTHSNY